MKLPGMDAGTANKIIAGRRGDTAIRPVARMRRRREHQAPAPRQRGMLTINHSNHEQIKQALGVDDAAAQAIDERDRRKAPNDPAGKILDVSGIGGVSKRP
jgi:DNA uptake protein ComE-like DNA-binding protein